MTAELGKLVLPTVRDTCQASDCGHQQLTDETGAYLHRNLNAGKDSAGLTVLCGPCHERAELHAREWLPVVAL